MNFDESISDKSLISLLNQFLMILQSISVLNLSVTLNLFVMNRRVESDESRRVDLSVESI